MFRIWFHGIDYLLLWMLAAFVLCSLHLAFYDLEHKDVRPIPEDAHVPQPHNAALKNKIVIFFVEGLRMSSFVRNIHKSNFLGRVTAHDGVWGHISWDPPPPGSVGLEPFFTGNPDGFGPSVLTLAEQVTFVGNEYVTSGLKLPRNYAKLDVVLPSSDYDLMIGGTTIDEPALAYVVNAARRRDLWKSGVEVLIVHLSKLGQVVRAEGEMSYQGQSTVQHTFAQLDMVLSELEQLFANEMVTYIVTSVGVEVPFLAWGHAIDKARFPDRVMFQQLSYQIPTESRDMNVLSIAPLLACLMDGSPPANSIGTLPDQYLGLSKQEIATCHIKTAENAMEQYQWQAHEVINGGVMNLASLSADIMTMEELKDRMERLKLASVSGDYPTVRSLAEAIINECLMGLEHYRNFRSRLLTHLIFLMLAGCLMCCATLLCSSCASEPANLDQNHKEWLRMPSLKIIPTVDVMFSLFLATSHILIGIDNFPLRYHLYGATTVIPWWIAFRKFKNWLILTRPDRTIQRPNVSQKLVDTFYIILCIVSGIAVACKLPIMVIFLVSMVFICLISLVTKSDTKVSLWLFTALPLVAALSYTSVSDSSSTSNIVAAICWLLVSWVVLYHSSSGFTDYPIILSNTIGALVIVFSSDIRAGYHVVWLVLGFVPLVGSQNLVVRLTQIFLSLGIPFILLSTSGEMMAFLAFVIHASTWMLAESYLDVKDIIHQVVQKDDRSIGRRFGSIDFRVNYFFNLYCLLAVPVVHEEGLKNACSSPHHLLRCDIKTAVPILAVSVLYARVVRRTGGQRYYTLLVSFLYFTFLIFFSFMNVYSIALSDGANGVYDVTAVQAPLKVWCSVLVCSWLADFLLCPSFINRKVDRPHQIA